MASPSSSLPFSVGAHHRPDLAAVALEGPRHPSGGRAVLEACGPGAGKVLRISLGTSSTKTPAICCAVSCWRRTGT